MATERAAMLLGRQLNELSISPPSCFSAGLVDDSNLYLWEILIYGPPDTYYEGGFFRALLEFKSTYPENPPKMRFTSQIWHPNISKDGQVCISILHDPGDDGYGYESAAERWLPIHTVESIVMSVISMLSEPNDESPANVDAAKDFREDYKGAFKEKVLNCVRKSQEDLS